jgi:hypothetical protein
MSVCQALGFTPTFGFRNFGTMVSHGTLNVIARRSIVASSVT